MRWFFSPLLILVGIALMKYSVVITNSFTGPISFAEQYLRTFGGTYAFWKLCGLGACIFGLLWLTGVIHYTPNSSYQISQSVYFLVQYK